MKKKKGTDIYEKKITLGKDANGKSIRVSVYASSRAELEQKVFRVRQEHLKKTDTPTENITMVSYARRWLEHDKAHTSINTKAMYTNVIEKHLEPAFTDLYFSEITMADLQELIMKNIDHANTCSKIKLTLKQIYAAAYEEKLIFELPNWKKLIIPKVKPKEKRALTEEEITAILTANMPDEPKAFCKTMYYTGIRREEALALKRTDFDFKAGTVTVQRTLVFDKNDGILTDSMKTDYSYREIPLPKAYIDSTREYIESHDLLFGMPTAPDKCMTQSSFTKFWAGIQRTLIPLAPSAETLTPYIFRHNYATMLYYSNVSLKAAAKLMGHKDTTMIMRIYAHLDAKKEGLHDKINAVFS